MWLPLAVLWFLLGAWCAEMEPHPVPARALAALSDGLLRTVEGTVINAGTLRRETIENVGESTNEEPSQRVDLRVSTIEVVNDAEDVPKPADGAIRLRVRWPQDGEGTSAFSCGDRIRTVVRLLPPETYRNPDAWSRAGYLLDQGITTTTSATIDRVERIATAQDRLLACRLADLQHAASSRILSLPAATRRLPPAFQIGEDDAVMLAAMTTGDRSFLTHSLRAGFERTGSFHMLVVSGFHIAIVAGCLFWIARRFRLPQIPATLVTIAGSFGYALFTGFATPVQRSLWMVALYLVGKLFFRTRNPLNTIGFAALCLLVSKPAQLV